MLELVGVIVAIIGLLGSFAAGVLWFIKLCIRASLMIRSIELSQDTLEQKVSNLLVLFSRIEDHSIRLAVVETKVDSLQSQNGKHEEFDS